MAPLVRAVLVGSVLLLNLADYSRRCERQFRSKNEIALVWDRPRDQSIMEFRNIFIVLAQKVRLKFNLLTENSHPILFVDLQKVRELGQVFEDLSSDHPIHSSLVRT